MTYRFQGAEGGLPMTEQPSEESLERAIKFHRHIAIDDGDACLDCIRLAFEFDAIAKERDAALIRANSGSELIKLRQQSAALVSALRKINAKIQTAGAERILANNFGELAIYFSGAEVRAFRAALAPYAAAEEKEKA